MFGSKFVYQLPEPYRRLPRPSSPLTAKASTVYAWSLDHITPSRLGANPLWGSMPNNAFVALTCFDTSRFGFEPKRLSLVYVFKEHHAGLSAGWLQSIFVCAATHPKSGRARYWWSQSGSNRRPPACKAGALPAELWPRKTMVVVGLGGLEPPASPLSGVRSNHLSYRPISFPV